MQGLKALIELIYPHKCPICYNFLKDSKKAFCDECLKRFKRLLPPFCNICSVPFYGITENIHTCENCLRKRPHFESISSPYLYDDIIIKAVHLFKYQGKMSISKGFGILLSEFVKSWWNWDKEDFVIVPVPLNINKLRRRGFNQSLILAKYVAKVLDIPIDYMNLRRTKDTVSQSLLKKNERKKNVKNAFKIMNNVFKNKKIILVDDVVTTGATLNECARVLKKAGAKEVKCLVFARTDPRGIRY